MTRKEISEGDQNVLSLLLDPSQPFDAIKSRAAQRAEAKRTLLQFESQFDADELRTYKNLLVEGIRKIEAINFAVGMDDSQISAVAADALVVFERAKELLPVHPGAFNDTAQAYRLLKKDQLAFRSLDKAIELSQGKGSVACQAFLQRALLKQLKLDEKGALADFEKAAALGSEFAASQMVKLNPIAKLCDKMVSMMINEVQNSPAKPS
ncbi:Oidioi.mRNA.OKI2018_I69.XSR.g14778.t1.cds [Oikopleura dioica]|uniref:Tetratricopeptide repeat protein 36 n=1 Tax=Oikopleura dioica TaxID=34765 RepID=A0ABN7SBB5_OIKDI|nr:Oidioi.mRNA.OKI2018_I69.XSR.g14778.t1.cds [Oikopleura dioica]